MKKILLIGCGNIGSRHLQSLLESNLSLDITVVEPSQDAINNTKSILSNTHNVTWISNISELTELYDFIIIATQSTNRYQLVNHLLESGNRRFLIEKMVCQSTNEYQKILENFKKFQAKGWVNTNFRYFLLTVVGYNNIPLNLTVSCFLGIINKSPSCNNRLDFDSGF